MANDIIRPGELPPRGSPVASEVVPSDNGSVVGGVTWAAGVNAGRPLANQAEAETGSNASKAMTPLTTKQAIDAQVPGKISQAISGLNLGTAAQQDVEAFATAGQGVLADTAVQPGDLSDVATSGDYGDLTGRPSPVEYTTQSLDEVQRLQSQANIGRRLSFDTVAAMLASSIPDYSAATGKVVVAAGDEIEAEGYRYEIAAPDATDHHLETAGGIRLYVLSSNVLAWGARADGVTDASPAIQHMIDMCETYGFGSCHIPGWTGNYRIDTPIVLSLGDLRVYGDKGAQFTHPFSDGTPRLMRQGNLVAPAGATHIFDLGGYKTHPDGRDASPYPPNPARNLAATYTLENLSMRGATYGQADAIRLTGMQNGPDRPYYLRGLSGYNFRYGVYVPPAPTSGVSTMGANLTLEGCTFNFGLKAVNVEGPIYGAYFANCNFEANAQGAVHGNLNGPVTLLNNMLENIPNPINLEPMARLSLLSRGNYFEYHPTSDYLYRIRGADTYLDYVVDVEGDFHSGTQWPTYRVVLEHAGRFLVKSPYRTLIKSVGADKALTIKKGSTLITQRGNLELDLLAGTIVAHVDGGFGRADIDNEWRHAYPHDPTKYSLADTPLGRMHVVDLADGIRIDAGEIIQNKLICTTLMVRCDPAMPVSTPARLLQARTPGGAYVKGPGNIVDYIAADISQGEWVNCAIIWRPINNVQTFELFVAETLRGQIQCAGATTRVFGAYVGDGSDGVKAVAPVTLNRQDVYGSNGNGQYRMFADGTMICWQTFPAISTLTGTETVQGLSVYHNTTTWTFPSAFMAGTVPVVHLSQGQEAVTINTGITRAVTNVSASLQSSSLTSPASWAMTKRAIAIGRWR